MKQTLKLSSIFIKSKPIYFTNFLIFFFLYFLLISYIALPEGKTTPLITYKIPNLECVEKNKKNGTHEICEPLGVRADATINDYLKFFKGSDVESYVRGGLLLAGQPYGGPYIPPKSQSFIEKIKFMNLIGFGMWPPGMYVLNSIAPSLSSIIPIALYQILVAVTLWSVVFALIASLLLIHLRLWLAFAIPAMLLFFPIFIVFFRYDVMSCITYGTAFTLISLNLLLLFYFKNQNIKLMLLAGLSFALGSFFRSQVFPIAIGFSILIVLFLFLKLRTDKSYNHKNSLLAGTLLFLLGLYLPLGSYMAINKGALFRVPIAWTLPFTLNGMDNFLVAGGMRAACIADPQRCERLEKEIKPGVHFRSAQAEVIKSFIFHPIKFSIYKLPIAWQFWMENPAISRKYRIDNLLILVLFIGCLIYMLLRKHWLLFFISTLTFLLILGPPFLLHFETRYFYILKAFILFIPLWLFFIEQSIKHGQQKGIKNEVLIKYKAEG